MSTVQLRRPTRAPRPVVLGEDLELQPPPELARGTLSNVWFTALPALSGLGSVAYLLAGPPNPITYVAGSFFLVSALAMVIGSLLSARQQTRGEIQHNRWEFLRYLDRTRDQVRRTAAAQRHRDEWGGPPPDTLWSFVEGERVWERRAGDDDFGLVRIGVGPQQLATALVPGVSGPVEDLDPLAAAALRRFVLTHRAVPDLPLRVALRRFAAIGVRSHAEAPDAGRAMVRGLLCQAAAFHSPNDLLVLVCTARPDDPDWSWVKWLPHAQHPTELDHAGPVRLIDPSLQVLEDVLGTELTRRAGFNPHAEPDPELPHVVVVLDRAHVTGTELALDPDGLAAVTVIDLDGRAEDVVRAGGVALELTADGDVEVVTGAHRERLGRADALALPVAEALARRIGRYRPAAHGTGVEDLSSVEASLPALLGGTDAAGLDLDRLWRPRPLRDRLTVPVGVSADGGVLELDIKESAQDGMGPHGVLVGATGSGKSEMLRTMVLGLAATHPPDVLNMVLVDFKGGATFAGMSALGHVSAVITNLQDDAALVDRMHEALSGELNRRQEILRAAGNLVSLRDYERARQRGAALPPLPTLFVIVDEFTELITQQEEFTQLFVQIGRLGRSLGIHLLLASQRLDEGRIRGLEAHLSYRIALRTFSTDESRAVLGVPEAYTLPTAPGHGLLKTDSTVLTRFRAAYVSGTYRIGAEGPGGRLPGTADVRPFPASALPVPPDVAAAVAAAAARERPPAADEEDPTQPTTMSVMVERIAARGGRAHQVWLPPLGDPDPLDALLGGLAERPGRGFGADPDSPPLRVAIGAVDLPFQQRRDPFVVDVSGSGGHVGIAGRPRSGKSTALRTLICALALRHTPAEVQFYCLDFSGSLFSLADLPHVGGIAGRQDADVVQRVVAEVATVVEDRERRFRDLGVDTMATYRRMRADGRVTDDPFGDVFLVVDGWSVLRGQFPDLEEQVLHLAARSLTVGVHLVLTTNRWLDLRMGLRDLLGTKTELKIGDAIDSDVDRKLAALVPPDRPGRGIGPHLAHHLVGVPRVDGVRSAEDLAEGVADLVARVAEAWTGAPAPRVRLLPRVLDLDELAPDPSRREILLGLEGSRLTPVRLDQRADPGMLLVGDQETGKTATLRAIARQILAANTPAEAKIVLVDYRRGMLGEFDGPSLLGYVGSAKQIDEVVRELGFGFDKRLPGPDVTPAQLRDRSWWDGPDVHVIVDDYELVAQLTNPLAPLLPYLAQARDVGLHLYVARRAGGASRALMDPVLGAMRELNFPAVLLSAPRDEMQLFGLKPGPKPPGRGMLVHRQVGTVPVHLARQQATVDV